MADIAASYGSGIFSRQELRDPELRIGLWLNTQRVETRRGLGVLIGIIGAIGDSPPLELFRAWCEDDELAERQHWDACVKRRMKRLAE